MDGINNVTIIGNIGSVGEITTLVSGQLVTLSVATTEQFTNSNSEKKSKTSWHSVVLWNNMAELSKMIQKGDLIYVEGRLNYREKIINETRTFFTEIVAKTIRILKRANPKEENKEESTDDFNY
jgi:single-strand DNA-binding protein